MKQFLKQDKMVYLEFLSLKLDVERSSSPLSLISLYDKLLRSRNARLLARALSGSLLSSWAENEQIKHVNNYSKHVIIIDDVFFYFLSIFIYA